MASYLLSEEYSLRQQTSKEEATLLLVDNDLGVRDVSKDDGQFGADQQHRNAHRAIAPDRNPFNLGGHVGLQTGRMPDQGSSSSNWQPLMHRPRT